MLVTNKNLKQKLWAAQSKCIHLWLDLLPCSHIGVTYFRQENWLQVAERVESSIETVLSKYWNKIVLSYINYICQSSLNRYNTRWQMALDIPLWKTNTWQQALSFAGQKIWDKISQCYKCKNYRFFYTYSEEWHFKQTVQLNNVVKQTNSLIYSLGFSPFLIPLTLWYLNISLWGS